MADLYMRLVAHPESLQEMRSVTTLRSLQGSKKSEWVPIHTHVRNVGCTTGSGEAPYHTPLKSGACKGLGVSD